MLALAQTEPLQLSLTSESVRKVQHIRIAFAIIEDQRGPEGGIINACVLHFVFRVREHR